MEFIFTSEGLTLSGAEFEEIGNVVDEILTKTGGADTEFTVNRTSTNTVNKDLLLQKLQTINNNL